MFGGAEVDGGFGHAEDDGRRFVLGDRAAVGIPDAKEPFRPLSAPMPVNMIATMLSELHSATDRNRMSTEGRW